MHTIADLISPNLLKRTHRVEVSKPEADAEQHGKALVDVGFSNRARIQSGLSILTDISAAIYVSPGVQNIRHALLLGVIQVVMGAYHIAVSITVTSDVPVPE